MNIVTLQQVEKSHGTRLLFKDVTITFTDDQRMGLIGVNGTGKSTLLKILAGQMHIDKGQIERNGKASIYYLPQDPTFNEEETVLENVFLGTHPLLELVRTYEVFLQRGEQGPAFLKALARMDEDDGWQVEQQGKTILTKLGLSDFDRPVKFLSGGQRRRLALAQALLYPCDLLLLDEPTNHLDESSIEWLEKFLRTRKGGLLMSTHDRYFLDSVCNGIVELSRERLYKYEGNYEAFLQLKSDREAMEAATEEKRRQFLKREIEWVRRGALARTTKQKARLQRYEALAAMERTRRADTIDPISLKRRLGKTIYDIEHLSFSYEDRPIIDDFTYHVVRHDRIGILGPNGVGKSTFLKLLEGELQPQSGTVGRGETVYLAHFTQEIPPFDEDMRILEYVREERRHLTLSDGSTLSAGQLLERFLFPPHMHGMPLSKLSGGEKRRLYLLKLLMSAPNVLLLDEPTNDLDIPTLEVLEDFLDSFGGIVFVVCHDRYFLDRVVDKLFVFKGNGHIEIVHGSYSDYVWDEEDDWLNNERKGAQQPHKNGAKEKSLATEVPTDKGKEKNARKLTFAEEKEYNQIGERITDLERLLKGIDAALGQIGSDYEDMKDLLLDREKANEDLETLTLRWLELEERIESSNE